MPPTPTPSPTDVCHHNCPDLLRFGKTGKPDQLIVRSAFGIGATVDPSDALTITLSNADGVVYTASLLPGDLRVRGRSLVFKDLAAKKGLGTRGGLALVKLQAVPKTGALRVTIEAYGDMSAATLAEMTLAITVGDDANAVTDVWEARAFGWQRAHR